MYVAVGSSVTILINHDPWPLGQVEIFWPNGQHALTLATQESGVQSAPRPSAPRNTLYMYIQCICMYRETSCFECLDMALAPA